MQGLATFAKIVRVELRNVLSKKKLFNTLLCRTRNKKKRSKTEVEREDVAIEKEPLARIRNERRPSCVIN